MAVAFRSSNTDTNTGGFGTITVPKPAGVQDGDFLVAAFSLPNGSGESVTTVPSNWTLIRRLDSSTVVSLVVYYKFASGEPTAGWTWVFSPDTTVTGYVSAYTGVDSFAPIDADLGQAVAATTMPAIPSVITSVPTVLVASFAIPANISFSAPSGYIQRAKNTRTNFIIASCDTVVSAVGSTTAATATIGASTATCSHVLALRPSVGMVSLEQARTSLKSHFPPGSADLYDWDNSDAELNKLTLAQAQFAKGFGFDYSDLITRQEFQPSTCVLKLPDWEGSLGISQIAASSSNTSIATRQNAVVSKLRESGATTLGNIRAVIEPLLGYSSANSGTLQVIECNRASLKTAHTYTNASSGTIPANGTLTQTVTVPDDGVISVAGAQFSVTITSSNPSLLTFTFTGPPATTPLQPPLITTQEVSPAFTLPITTSVTSQTFLFYDILASGKSVGGTWSLAVASTVGSTSTLVSWNVFVEGAGIDAKGYNGLGSAIYDWGVFVDPTKTNNPDYVGVQRALDRIHPGFSVAHIIRGSATVSAGSALAIPDDPSCLPDQVIPS